MESYLDGKVTLYRGDCLEVLPALEADSIDSCVTDPPYGIHFMGKTWDKFGGPTGKDNTKHVLRGGAMHAGSYDLSLKGMKGFQEFTYAWASLALKALKPGGHILCFASTRTYHRMACAIEDAGFEIRDQIGWCYGSGFPKSHDVSKGIDRMAGAEREVVGLKSDPRYLSPRAVSIFAPERGGNTKGTAGLGHGTESAAAQITAPATEAAIQWQGWGTALKPAWEPICLARKPLSESSIAANVLRHGTGAINVDGCRIEAPEGLTSGGKPTGNNNPCFMSKDDDPRKERSNGHALGRWPANLIHDGSEEVVSGFPETANSPTGLITQGGDHFSIGSDQKTRGTKFQGHGDSGSAARFFYTAKADTDDRLGSKHPTVKPLDLMQYLVRLVTPKGGVVLDPFAGTGTTGEAAWREGMRVMLIEREAEYQSEIERRMGLCLSGPDARRAASVEQLHYADLPMFRGLK